jgi:selenoprotein W-related protein
MTDRETCTVNKPRLEIEYCIQCGFLLRAAWIAQELLSSFPEELGEVALRPGSGGNFIVRLEQGTIFSRREQGRFPESKELNLETAVDRSVETSASPSQ